MSTRALDQGARFAASAFFGFFIATKSVWHLLVARGSSTSEYYGQGENALPVALRAHRDAPRMADAS